MNITPILVMHIHNSVGLNICPYFWSYSPSLNSTGNKTEKNLSVLISFGLKKPVGLNILVESVLIFSVLVTGPNKAISKNEFHIIFLRHYPNVRRGENRVKLSALFDHQSERSNVVHDVSGNLAGIGNARALLLRND
jgi:hypothetical protein